MQNNRSNLILGVFFIVIGAVWALDNLEIIPWQIRHYVFQWENFLIGFGAILLFTGKNRQVGSIFLALGVFFALDDWFDINVSLWDFWPLALVFVGIYLLNKNRSPKKYDDPAFEKDAIDDTSIFSGGDKVFSSQDFKGGNLTAIFGGSNIDLTTAKIKDKRAEIDVFYMFGGSKIRVPQHWHVELRCTNLFGGISDKRHMVSEPNEDSPVLILKGLILFGGAEVTN